MKRGNTNRTQREESKKQKEDGSKTEDYYEILGVDRSATVDVIRRAYYRLALQHHPDRQSSTFPDTTRFQAIGRAYEILSDPKRRERYDQGDDDLNDDTLRTEDEWRTYFESLYDRVTEERLEEFASIYKGSEEEKSDLIQYYEKFMGDWEQIHAHLMLSSVEEEERYVAIIEEALKNKTVKQRYEIFFDEKRAKKRQKAAVKESKEAEKAAKEIKKGKENQKDLASLAALIQRKQVTRQADLIASLEAKYSKKK